MKPSNESQTYSLTLCRGANPSGCRHGLGVAENFEGRIRQVVEDSGWDEFLRSAVGKGLRHHHAFQVSAAVCPNGCSRPHVADVAFIRACEPLLDPAACTSCGQCAEDCPDEAISMVDGLPVIDREACLDCGRCTMVCPSQAMGCARTGWRVLAGGRLGRHPRLARELDGWHEDDAALAILDRALKLYMSHYSPSKRFGRVLDDMGLAPLLEEGD